MSHMWPSTENNPRARIEKTIGTVKEIGAHSYAAGPTIAMAVKSRTVANIETANLPRNPPGGLARNETIHSATEAKTAMGPLFLTSDTPPRYVGLPV
jgi:hypothetical protein